MGAAPGAAMAKTCAVPSWPRETRPIARWSEATRRATSASLATRVMLAAAGAPPRTRSAALSVLPSALFWITAWIWPGAEPSCDQSRSLPVNTACSCGTVRAARRLAGLTMATTASTATTCSLAGLVRSTTLARCSTSSCVGGRTDIATSAVPRIRAAKPEAELPAAMVIASCWPAWLPMIERVLLPSPGWAVMSESPIRARYPEASRRASPPATTSDPAICRRGVAWVAGAAGVSAMAGIGVRPCVGAGIGIGPGIAAAGAGAVAGAAAARLSAVTMGLSAFETPAISSL